MSAGPISVEVAYTRPDTQIVIAVDVAAGARVEDAVRASGILKRFPEIDLARAAVGIFGTRVPLTAGLRTGDRIEIYRPLTADPKEARRRRAAHRR